MIKEFIKKHIFPLIPTLKIPSVSNISLNFELHRQFKRLKPGLVLDIGSGWTSRELEVPHTQYLTLDIREKCNTDICCDLYNIQSKSNCFDVVLMIEVLEHLLNPEKAVKEIHRVLKKGGVCILAAPFIYPYHPSPDDCYRFTWDSLRYLFSKFSKVEIYHHGNRPQAIWELLNKGHINIVLNIFNPLIARIGSRKTKTPCGFVVYAEK